MIQAGETDKLKDSRTEYNFKFAETFVFSFQLRTD